MFQKQILFFMFMIVGFNVQASNQEPVRHALEVEILRTIAVDLHVQIAKKIRDYDAIEAGRTPSPQRAAHVSSVENTEASLLKQDVKEKYKTLSALDAAILSNIDAAREILEEMLLAEALRK